MNLIQFRQWFRTASGRYDLVDPTGADLGVGNFIESAQRYLDRLADIPHGYARNFLDVAAGLSFISIVNCRSIERVYCIGPTGGNLVKSPMLKYVEQEKSFFDPRYSDSWDSSWMAQLEALPAGRPQVYNPVVVRPIWGASRGEIGQFATVVDSGYDSCKGMEFYPQTDQAYVFEVLGKFNSHTLILDTDSNYWTSEQPNLLLMSVLRQLEIFHRNSEGVKDWDAAIATEITQLDMDGVAQEVAEINLLQG